jgi:hypothetical protein
MARNFLKAGLRDSINALMAVAAFNFKNMDAGRRGYVFLSSFFDFWAC